jgi:alpha-L-fucosidase
VPQDYKTAGGLIGDLVDIVSKNGNLLLNVGPRADGSIAEEEVAILREIGGWLRINGEAIYETRPWRIFGEGPTEISEGKFTDTQRQAFTSQDIRFTTKDGALYAICLDWPETPVMIHALGSAALSADRIAAITMLGAPDALSWSQHDDGLHIQPPAQRPCDHAVTFKIALRDERPAK